MLFGEAVKTINYSFVDPYRGGHCKRLLEKGLAKGIASTLGPTSYDAKYFAAGFANAFAKGYAKGFACESPPSDVCSARR